MLIIVSFSSLLILHRSTLSFPKRLLTKANKFPPDTMPIVAEYAKSNRSSCKSCSKTIASKALRLGLITKGPGGVDMTRWHHFDCFPTHSEPIASVDDIQGLASLEKDDQDALEKLVKQSGESAKQLDRKEEEKKHHALDEVSGKKVKETKDSSASSDVVAEYAKSGRSACKKCSHPIASNTLRVGLMGKGPGGVDMARWHHLDCFPTDSETIASVDDIKGFTALQKDDQDALAKLVEQCGNPTKEVDKKDAEFKCPASDEVSGKKIKETKGPSASPNVVAEYAKSSRSACKKCSQPIASKTLRVGLIGKGPGGVEMARWHHFDCFPTALESIASVDDIKGFSVLEKDDQDALAKLVEQCGESTKEVHEKEIEIKHPASDEMSGKKIKETKGSSASSKVIAEYAKSGRSSCKKCSQTIAAKELRLGLVTRDSRGFDMTKWYHLGCFPIESDPVESVEDIGGFSSLQNGDQDALKKLVQQCQNKTSKMDDDDAESGTDNLLTEETDKRKLSQVGDMVEEDELQAKQATKKSKMNITESTSQVEVETEISLSASDVKDKYRDASLLPKWKAFETVIFLERDDGLSDSEKIAAFDFDGCLAKTSVKVTGADAWSLMYPSIPEKLQSLYSQGYKLVIFTNESNIDRWKNKRQVAVDSKIGRLNSFIKRVEVPIQVFIACGVGSSGGNDDLYRKPKAGMWQLMKKHFNSGIAIDMDKSFYVGDAAGRKGDHSDADIKFAQASGLKFYTPEEYFLS